MILQKMKAKTMVTPGNREESGQDLSVSELNSLQPNPEWANLTLFDRKGWRRLPFGAFAENINERVEPADAYDEIYVGLDDLDSGDLHIRRWGKGSDVVGTKLRFRKGDLIFGRRRAYQRKLAVAEMNGICSAHAMVVRAKREYVLPEFLPFLMKSDRFMKRAMEISVGSLSPTINWKALKKEEFVLPPLSQQRRIAEVMWGVENTRIALNDAINNSIAYSEMYFENSVLEIKDQDIAYRSIGELISARIIDSPQDGNHGGLHPKASDYKPDGIPFVMANDLQDGLIRLDKCKRIPKSIAEKLRIGFAKPGDVLLSHKGTVGLVAVVPVEISDYVMLTPQVTYYRILNSKGLLREYLMAYMNSSRYQAILKTRAKQSTRDYIGITAQKALPIVVPRIQVQEEIISELIRLKCLKENLAKSIGCLDRVANLISRKVWTV